MIMNKTIGQEKLCYDAPGMEVLEVSTRMCIALLSGSADTEGMSEGSGAWGYGSGNEGYEEVDGEW